MRLFGVELTHQSPAEQNQPSSPIARDFTRPEGVHQSSSPERRTGRDFIRSPEENSTSRAGQHPIGDFTRHFAQNPSYHQVQGEASSAFRPWGPQQLHEARRTTAGAESHVLRPVAQRPSLEAHKTVGSTQSAFHPSKSRQSQETQKTVESTQSRAFHRWEAQPSQQAQHRRDLHQYWQEQPLPSEASCSRQQHQGALHLHARIDNIQQALQFSWNELERLRPPVSHTEHMAQPPEEILLSNDEVATVFTSDSQGGPNQNSSHKRKRDEARSRKVQTTLDRTIPVDDPALQQQTQSDQAVNDQRNESSATQSSVKKRDYKTEYQQYKERLAKQGTTLYAIEKARVEKQGTTPYAIKKARAEKQGTTPYAIEKARVEKQGTTLYAIKKARVEKQGTTLYAIKKARAEKQGTTLYAKKKARAEKQGTTLYAIEKARVEKQGTTPYAKKKARAEKQGMTVSQWNAARKQQRLAESSTNPNL
jgi:hypothetical protein